MLDIVIPIVVVFLGVASFEVAMAVTISTLPRSRMQHRWTKPESRRAMGVFATVFSTWPTIAAIVLGHLFLPLLAALLLDAVVITLYFICVRWLVRSVKQQRLILSGHCANCLYDLRASRDKEHCPECGKGLADHPAKLAAR